MKIETKKDLEFANSRFIDLKHRLINKKSKAEKHFEDLLKNAGIYYIREKANFRVGTLWCYYDFYIPRLRLYVEIDGAEHNNEANRKKDIEKESYIKSRSAYIIRFTNEEVNLMSVINANILLDKVYKTVRKDKYYGCIRYIRRQQENDIKEQYPEENLNDKVYLYNHNNGMFYEFKNVFKCIAYTSIKAKTIIELLHTEYKKSSTRMYVIGRTQNQCEANVSETYY